NASFDYELAPNEVDLIETISQFPTVVQKAAEDYKPLLMATYAFELAKSFHTFYHNVRVLQADSEEQVNSRLRITAAARRTIANALALLDIEAPQIM
ncbi:MAG: DALR anticodon-binding domain-containing protein, partial [Anaerolineales bacterium]